MLEPFNEEVVFKMSARKSLSKLTLPTDIGNEERFLSHRPSLIQEKLIKCYAEEIASAISVLVVENCNGCIIDHPSQRQHPCLSDIKPRVNGLELLKYTCHDWRTIFCANERRLLKQETHKLL